MNQHATKLHDIIQFLRLSTMDSPNRQFNEWWAQNRRLFINYNQDRGELACFRLQATLPSTMDDALLACSEMTPITVDELFYGGDTDDEPDVWFAKWVDQITKQLMVLYTGVYYSVLRLNSQLNIVDVEWRILDPDAEIVTDCDRGIEVVHRIRDVYPPYNYLLSDVM